MGSFFFLFIIIKSIHTEDKQSNPKKKDEMGSELNTNKHKHREGKKKVDKCHI